MQYSTKIHICTITTEILSLVLFLLCKSTVAFTTMSYIFLNGMKFYNFYNFITFTLTQSSRGENSAIQLLWFSRRQWHPTPVLLPGKSHGLRRLEGCSSWGGWGLDTTERLYFHFSLSCMGEWNGNPLQCSCLENPRDGGTWWAAVYGVAQSQTRLKWLSIAIKLLSFNNCLKSSCSAYRVSL